MQGAADAHKMPNGPLSKHLLRPLLQLEKGGVQDPCSSSPSKSVVSITTGPPDPRLCYGVYIPDRHAFTVSELHTLGKDSATFTEEGTEDRSGEAGGSAGFCVCCCASVLCMVANLRCRRSTYIAGPHGVLSAIAAA